MNLVSLEYFLTNKTQNMDLNALLLEKFEAIFFATTRCSLPYIFDTLLFENFQEFEREFVNLEAITIGMRGITRVLYYIDT